MFHFLAAMTFVVVTYIIILGIIHMVVSIDRRITRRRIKKFVRQNEHLHDATRAVCRSIDGNAINLDVLRVRDGSEQKFCELTVTGDSSAKNIKPGTVITIG